MFDIFSVFFNHVFVGCSRFVSAQCTRAHVHAAYIVFHVEAQGVVCASTRVTKHHNLRCFSPFFPTHCWLLRRISYRFSICPQFIERVVAAAAMTTCARLPVSTNSHFFGIPRRLTSHIVTGNNTLTGRRDKKNRVNR